MEGLIVKAIAGFYYVDTSKGVYQCRARGAFKNEGITPLVGDRVEMEIVEKSDADAIYEEGVVTKLFPRENQFIRPPVANLDVMVITFALKNPKPNLRIIDKLILSAEIAGVDIAICINKTDLDDADGSGREELANIYGNIYDLFFVSCKENIGIEELKKHIVGKTVAFVGPSGAGKSSLLNILKGKQLAATGDISKKTGRGKHTTRHVELFSMDDGGKILDTPGFTSFDAIDGDITDLDRYFPEMEAYLGKCKFDNCKHIHEPQCAVREAVEAGHISKARYESYLQLLEEMKNNKLY